MINKENIKNILIVDDSGTARLIIQQCLEIIGFNNETYFEAANGKEALGILDHNTIDLLLTDLNMPIMDGKSLLKEIKLQFKHQDLSIVVITSSFNKAKEQELKELGADVVINKPISPSNILSALQL